MRRREFIALVASAGLARPVAGRAQQPPFSEGRPAVLGWLGYAQSGYHNEIGEGILTGLRDLGWIEGKTIVVEWRFAERQPSRLSVRKSRLGSKRSRKISRRSARRSLLKNPR